MNFSAGKVSILLFRWLSHSVNIHTMEMLMIFTAQCYAEHGYATVCHLSVRLSVTFRYSDHIGWNA